MRLAPTIPPEVLRHSDPKAKALGMSRGAYVAHLLAVPAPLPDLPSGLSLGSQVTLRVSDQVGEALHTAASDAELELRVYISRLLMR